MALYLLNISVDTPDPYPEHIPEDLSFNDQESIIEIVLEQFLGYEDAIKEYDDHDTEDYNKKENVKINFLLQRAKTDQNTGRQCDERKKRYPAHNGRLLNGFKQISGPPPKI